MVPVERAGLRYTGRPLHEGVVLIVKGVVEEAVRIVGVTVPEW